MNTHLFTLVLLMFSSACCLAQSEWKIVEGHDRFQKFISYKCDTDPQSLHMGPNESTLLVHSRTKQSVRQITAFDLATLEFRSSMPVPAGWDWGNAAFGTRYACSLKDENLILIDLSVGEIVGTVTAKRGGKLSILFDAAILVGDVAFEIPSLKRLTDHPLVSALQSNPASGPPKNGSIWRRDQDTWVINGLQFGRDLKLKWIYLGKYGSYEADPNKKAQRIDELKLAREYSPRFALVGQRDSVSIRLEPPDAAVLFNENLSLQPNEFGFIGVHNNYLVALYSSEDAYKFKSSRDWRDVEFISPPIIASDGLTVQLTLEGADANYPRISEIRIANETRYVTSETIGSSKLTLTNNTSFIHATLLSGNAIEKTASLVREQANVGLDASAEEIIRGYMAANQNWIDRVAQRSDYQFQGLPLEVECWLITENPNDKRIQCRSAIVDIPLNQLRHFLPRNKVAGQFNDRTEVVESDFHYIQQVLRRERIQTDSVSTLNSSPPPTGTFYFVGPAHETRLLMLLPRILLDFLVLVSSVFLTAKIFNGDCQLYGNRYWTAFMMASATVLLDTAFLFAVDFATEAFVGESIELLVARALLKFLAYIVFMVGLCSLGVKGSWQAKLVVSVMAIVLGYFALVTFVILAAVFQIWSA